MEEQHDGVASPQEVYAAIQKLSNDDLGRLAAIARIRSWGRPEQDPDDLVSEALVRTLDGRRKWRNGIPFLVHLEGVIRSTSGHEEEKTASVVSLDAGETTNGDGGAFVGVVAMPRVHEMPGQEAAEKKLQILKQFFADDEDVLLILDSWRDGMSAKDVLDLGLSEKDYKAAVKRIRRYVLSLPKNKG